MNRKDITENIIDKIRQNIDKMSDSEFNSFVCKLADVSEFIRSNDEPMPQKPLRVLKVKAYLRWSEDATVNDQDDVIIEEIFAGKTPLMPFVTCDKNCVYWCPTIDIDNGKIIDWPVGTKAITCYKVTDECVISYHENGVEKTEPKRNYVPECLCRDDNGYGDYMDLTIDENGQIANWSTEQCIADIKKYLKYDV